MSWWRFTFVLGFCAFLVLPLSMPVPELLASSVWVWTADDVERLLFLSQNTLALLAGTLALSLPLGICLAVLVFRTSFPGRQLGVFLLVLSLFIPIPIVVSAWQGMFGPGGLLPTDFWRNAEGRLWTTGLPAAIWLHALVATPWVAFLVGVGLTWVEPEAEEEATLIASPARVLLMVTLPRARASILGAALFVGLQTFGEASIAELTLVPHLAEEMRTQFALNNAGLARTLVLTLPCLVATGIIVWLTLSYLERNLPPLVAPARIPRPIDCGPGLFRGVLMLAFLALFLLPLAGLIWKVGLIGHPGHWDRAAARHFVQAEWKLLGGTLTASVVLSLITGAGVAGVALVSCWLARDSAWFRVVLFGFMAWVWVLPGPALGMALHKLFLALPAGPWKHLLYYGPSPLPLVWAQGLRALPIAVVFLWPVVRMVPRELIDAARLGGAGPVSAFLHVTAPNCWRATLVVAMASAALCLGELGASARVETPGWDSFAKILFDRMHYGVDNNVSALCLLMLAAIIGLAASGAGILGLQREPEPLGIGIPHPRA